MTDLKSEYVALMATIDLEQRYYAYIDAQPRQPTELSPRNVLETVESILSAQVEELRYDKKEKFFRYTQTVQPYRFIFTIALSGFGALELIHTIEMPSGKVGGTIHGLARNINLLRDENFSRSPRYPRIPFVDEQDLSKATAFSQALFDDIKQTVIQAKFGQ